MATARRRKLNRAEVQKLIDELLAQENINKPILFAFADTINGVKFKEQKAPKKKATTMTAARKAKSKCQSIKRGESQIDSRLIETQKILLAEAKKLVN